MMKIIESMKKLFAYKKSIVAIFVIVAILLTTSTFSYWASSVHGNNDETTMGFRIGEYITTLFDFVLNEEEVSYLYEVDIEYLLEDYENNEDEVLFGIIWDDPDLTEEFKDRVVDGDIEVDFEFKFYEDGEEVSSKTYRALQKLIRLNIDNNNPNTITYGESAEIFEFLVKFNKNRSLKQVSELLDYEVYIEIIYTIDY